MAKLRSPRLPVAPPKSEPSDFQRASQIQEESVRLLDQAVSAELQPRMKKIGEFIRSRRRALEISKGQMSRKSGVSHTPIETLENGKAVDVKLGTLLRISFVLKCTLVEIVDPPNS